MGNCHVSSGGGAVLMCVCVCVCVWLSVNITNKDKTVVSIWYTNSPTAVTQLMCDNNLQTSPKSTYSTTMSLWFSDDVRKAMVWPGCTEEIRSLKGKHVYCFDWNVSVCWNMRACSCTIPADNRLSQQQLQAMGISAVHISPPGLFEKHWMMYVQYGLMCILALLSHWNCSHVLLIIHTFHADCFKSKHIELS